MKPSSPRDKNFDAVKYQLRRKHAHSPHEGHVKRISMSLPPSLLAEFDRAMKRTGYSDRSKAMQTAIHSFIDESGWKEDDDSNGAGVIILLYNNHIFNHDSKSTEAQHDYTDIISAVTHTHLDHENCLETIMVRGRIRRIKSLAKKISENRGIKSLKVNFVSVV